MRGLSTAFLGLIGTLAFCGAFVATSVLTYVTSPVAMVATAQESDAYGIMLDVVDRVVEGELKQGIEPAFERHALSRARDAVRKAAPEEWFYGTMAGVLRDLEGLVLRGEPARPIALGPMRSDLREELMSVGQQVRSGCAGLTGSPACADEEVLAELIRVYEGAVARVTGRIPEQADVRALVAESGTDWLAPDSPAVARARQVHGWGRMARWGCLGLFVLTMLLIAWINHAPLSRLLTALGVVSAIAAGTYLLAARFADDAAAAAMARARVGERLEVTERAREVGHGDVGPVLAAGAERLVPGAVRDALRVSEAPATILLAAGVGAIAGGLLLRRRPRERTN